MEELSLGRTAPVYFLTETDSTNLQLRTLAAEGAPEGTVLAALRQTAGRGRLGRSFLSPEGGLYLSLLLYADKSPERDFGWMPEAAVAVARAVERASGLRCGIKWPNDVILENKKLCGILAESFFAGDRRYIVLGIGVNLNTPAFPPQLPNAVSLRQVLGRDTELMGFLRLLVAELDTLCALRREDPCPYLAAYRLSCLNLGREALLSDGRAGLAEDVDESYALLVRLPDGSLFRVNNGEVSVRGLYGYI